MSTTDASIIYIWNKSIAIEGFWSAYAPHFEEIETNQIHVEKEDEFDVKDDEQQKRLKRIKQAQLEMEPVDITTIENTNYDSDASNDEVRIPIDPIPDEKMSVPQLVPANPNSNAPAKKKRGRKPKKKKKTTVDTSESDHDNSQDDDFLDDDSEKSSKRPRFE